ncbi:hypothetical protein [Methylobacterium sp. Leaf108]|uniref:hypothetical protein n=1 Tax=Methylobacterium sp. Leaf108 TaxID=1736256 RepID=UPI0007004336|nr:hypothetical protein [Methylobacterium sp. Leaf108]KQP51506.1 hypothetical protein ASF39_10870 [Methylobacterium sp. Leaf108]
MSISVTDGPRRRDDYDLIVPHFDAGHYRTYQTDLSASGGDPVLHFLMHGWRQGLSPSAAFDTKFYLDLYPNLLAENVNPLVHYLRHGAWAGYLPRSNRLEQRFYEPGAVIPSWAFLLPTDSTMSEVRRLVAGHFDETAYRALCPDLDPTGGDALLHYLLWGWRQGLRPQATDGFDDAFYCETYPDVAGTDISPLLHYLRWGAWAGRLARRRPKGREFRPATPDTPGWLPVRPSDEQIGEARVLTEGHFDEAHYLSQAPDLSPAGGDAFLHFLVWGWREGLNPGPGFDVGFYLTSYPEVAATDVNPLLHYLRDGVHRDMLPRKSLIPWRTQLDQARSGRERAARIGPVQNPTSINARDLARALVGADEPAGVAVVLSHDDFTRSLGGVKNVIEDEFAGFRAAGWRHLHVWPLRIIPILADPAASDEAIVQLFIDGEPAGTASVADLLQAIADCRTGGRVVQVIVHHLAGHAPEHVQALVAAAGSAPPLVWLHDYFTLCTNYALMRNDIAFCRAPPVDSPACAICCYGEERADHLRRMRTFFRETLPVVLAPSETALELWRGQGFDHARAVVTPLARLDLDAPVHVLRNAPGPVPRPIRVAFLGTRIFLKGWATFQALVERHAADGRYAFFQFGMPDGLPSPANLHAIPVAVKAEDRDAMARAIEEHEIDVVVVWSLCRETFSFTLHEALAGGAFVVARKAAGNVWPALAAHAPEQGCALADEDDLKALFAGDRIGELVARPRAKGRLKPGRGALDWLAANGTVHG